MNSMFIFCDECGKKQEFIIIDMQEGDDCWKVVKLECSECGMKKEIKLYC